MVNEYLTKKLFLVTCNILKNILFFNVFKLSILFIPDVDSFLFYRLNLFFLNFICP